MTYSVLKGEIIVQMEICQNIGNDHNLVCYSIIPHESIKVYRVEIMDMG